MRNCLLVLLFVCVITAEEFPAISAMHESGSIVNTTFFNAGGAFPANTSSASLNPAIPAAWHYFAQKKMSVFGSYHQNKDTDYYKTGGGGSLALGMGKYLSVEYNLKNAIKDDNPKFHRGTIGYGAMISGNEDDPLFFGANISYYNFDGVIKKSGLVPVKYDTVSHGKRIDYYQSNVFEVSARNNFISTDLGFYQPGDGKGLSWGIVFENILGYSWNKHDHTLKHDRSEKTYIGKIEEEINLDSDKYIYGYEDKITIKKDSAYYVAENRKSHNFLSKKYNSFLLATNVLIPMAGNKIILSAPLDFRFWGLMNKPLRKSSKLKHRTEIHSGFELLLGSKICGRFGWAWVPQEYTTSESGQLNFSDWDNRFSGGIGVNIGFLTIDMMFAKKTFGAGLSFQL